MSIPKPSLVASSVLVTACIVVAFTAPSFAQTDRLTDRFVGTWKVNVAKSTYHPGPPPAQGAMVRWEKVPNGIRQIGLGADGKPVGTAFVANFDGKEYPVSGNAAYDTTVWTRVDEFAFNFTRKKAGQVVQMATRTISTDGNTSTLTVIGVDAKGQPFSTVTVWEKQP